MDVSGNIRRESTAGRTRASIVIMLFVCFDNPINLYGCALCDSLDMSKVKGYAEGSRVKIHDQS